MTERGINLITRWVVLGPFILWAAWELAQIWFQRRGWDVRLISQEARSLAYRGMPSLAFFLTGLSVHFFLSWRSLPWSDTLATVAAVAWWAIGAAYLVADVLDPNRAYWPAVTLWLRWPPFVAIVGAVSAFFLFPQRALWSPPGAP